MAVNPPLLDKHAVALAFSRAAQQYDQVAGLQREVFETLITPTLLGMAAEPANRTCHRIVDVGCGTGALTRRLANLFPAADILGIDIAPGMLSYARCQPAGEALGWVCGDAEQLPLQTASVDLIVSNFALQWCEDFTSLFADMRRVLVPGGRVLFTLPGQGTLCELEASWQQADPAHQHVNRFPSLSLLSDVAKQTGWNIQRLAVQPFQTQYPRVQDLFAELKTLGAHNVNRGRAQQLTGKQRVRNLLEAYESFRNRDGLLPATWQVIVGEWNA